MITTRTVHLVAKVENLALVRQEMQVAQAYLRYRKAEVIFSESFSTFWATPEGKVLELEVRPADDGWQIILLE